MIEPLEERLIGRYTKKSVKHPETGEIIVGPDVLTTEDICMKLLMRWCRRSFTIRSWSLH